MAQLAIVPEAQIIFYAKGAFKKGDLLNDLLVVVADYLGMYQKDINETHVLRVLYGTFCMYIPEHRRRRLLEGMLIDIYLKSARRESISLGDILNPILGVLSIVRVLDENKKMLVNLGNPNYSLLPRNYQW